ncbi:MAG: DUF1294 domain-containing protein [Erysipelotrichales bacterium]|jgi:uncharacterized membrane protein YsdA (DUF1294 family)|nr:DUF1294 domain-containing protein [Erysipelotrichales bacterium]
MDAGKIILIALNVISFLLFGLDKRYAKTDHDRIPEKTLWFSALLFAGPGAYLGMKVFHHKTKKTKFRYGMPLLILIQMAALVYLYGRGVLTW